MRTLDIVNAAVTNTFRSKLRTTLTIVAIIIGAFTLTITSAIGTGVNSYITTQVAAMGAADVLTITKQAEESDASDAGPRRYDPDRASLAAGQAPRRGEVSALSMDDIEMIRETPGIVDTDPVVRVSPDYIEYQSHGKFELSIDTAAAVTAPDLVAGSNFDDNSTKNELLLPNSYLKSLGFDGVKDALGKTVLLGITDHNGTQHETQATIVGVKNESLFAGGVGLNRLLTTDLVELQNQGKPATPIDGFATATAHIDPNSSPAEVNQIKADLDEQGFSAQTTADQLGAFETIINGIVGVLNAFAVIALIAAGFGIINTLLMSVQERTREIGLMKAMGMSGRKIYAMFSMEAIFIGFLGSAIGAVLAIGLGSIVSNALSETVLSGLPGLNIMQFSPASIAAIIGVVMLIAFIAGTLPAGRAARQNPIDALRYE